MKKLTNIKLLEIDQLSPINKIRKVIQILRDPIDGCPWDLKQNYDSLAQYSVEEAYELVNAIDNKNPNEIKKELGDLLFSVKYFANEELFQESLLSNYEHKNFIETYKLNIQHRAKLMLEKYKNKYD